MKEYVIVGVGGVGTRIANSLVQFLSHAGKEARVLLVDGDEFEPKNAERQEFIEYGHKALSKANELSERFPGVQIIAVPEYLGSMNIERIIPDGATVFACVDNYATRKLMSDHVSSLANAVLISGGNNFHDGGVQIHVRRDGKDETPPITFLHPEIEFPADKNPADVPSCEQLAQQGEPQLLFANLTVATEMLCLLWATENAGGKPPYTELHFDLTRGARRTTIRRVEHVTEAEDRKPGIGAERGGFVSAAAAHQEG